MRCPSDSFGGCGPERMLAKKLPTLFTQAAVRVVLEQEAYDNELGCVRARIAAPRCWGGTLRARKERQRRRAGFAARVARAALRPAEAMASDGWHRPQERA